MAIGELDAREFATSIREYRDKKAERKQKLEPLIRAGWRKYHSEVVRKVGGARLHVEYVDGEYDLSFYGLVKRRRNHSVKFDTAEELLRYVEEVEELL